MQHDLENDAEALLHGGGSAMTTFRGPALGELADGPRTLGAFLDDVVARHGRREALVLDDDLRGGETVRWTYGRLGTEARRIGRALVAAGVDPGDSVAIVMGNRPEAVASIFGAALAGAVAIPMSTFATVDDLDNMLRRSEAVVALTQERLLSRRYGDELVTLEPDLPALRTVATVATPSWTTFLGAGDERSDADTTLDERSAAVTPDDSGVVIFTSGTTSEPKGIVHAHRAPTQQFHVQAHLFGRTVDTRLYCALPIFWTAGLTTAMGPMLAAGGCWVMQETFDGATALALISRERVTEPYTLPHQTQALTEQPAWPDTDLSSLRSVYGKSAFARHPTVHGDPDWMSPVGYGMSETAANVAAYPSSTPREQMVIGTGRLLPGNELRVVDPDTGVALGVGQEGELRVKGPTLMTRYLGRTPAECFDGDGFFATGDTGHVDADGILHWSGRLTEMIKTGGANVSPAELEVQLRACEPVKLSRIVGIPDARLDQIVVACITLKDGADATPDDVRAFLRGRVAPYKVPKHVLFFADGEIPMNTNATKVRDDELIELVQRRLAADVPA